VAAQIGDNEIMNRRSSEAIDAAWDEMQAYLAEIRAQSLIFYIESGKILDVKATQQQGSAVRSGTLQTVYHPGEVVK